jgi:hypothetical protein
LISENAESMCVSRKIAEKEGFEPPVPVKEQRFSRPPHSTALPFLRVQKYKFFHSSANFSGILAEELTGKSHHSNPRIAILQGRGQFIP